MAFVDTGVRSNKVKLLVRQTHFSVAERHQHLWESVLNSWKMEKFQQPGNNEDLNECREMNERKCNQCSVTIISNNITVSHLFFLLSLLGFDRGLDRHYNTGYLNSHHNLGWLVVKGPASLNNLWLFQHCCQNMLEIYWVPENTAEIRCVCLWFP